MPFDTKLSQLYLIFPNKILQCIIRSYSAIKVSGDTVD